MIIWYVIDLYIVFMVLYNESNIVVFLFNFFVFCNNV